MSESVNSNHQPTAPAVKPHISFADWQKLDIRLGTIISATNPEWSNKLIELQVNFGVSVGVRTIFTGLRQWKQPEDFMGKQGLFLLNLPARKMGEGVSEGMFLSMDPPGEHGQVTPLVVLFDTLGPEGSTLC